MKFIIIGITDNPKPWFPPEVMDIIRSGKVFSGGKRHHDIVAPLLPVDAEWIDIVAPLDAVFEQYKAPLLSPQGRTKDSSPKGEVGRGHIIIFASGDPLFYGFANTVLRKFKDIRMKVYPAFNSLQMLAHRMCTPYHDMHVVSLTGRDWKKFDEALINGYTMIGCLTDRIKTPHTIFQRMKEYGYTNYIMTVGENLGNEEKERVSRYDENAVYDHPNCIILQQTAERAHPFGIPDKDFSLLNGREKMITKMPIRLLTLQALELQRKRVFWDIGFCTGSVSIEARLQFPHLQVEAFEVRPQCEAIIKENAHKLGAPGINIHMGDFLQTDLSRIPVPDAVFIGGHGGRLMEIMEKVKTVIAKDGVIVMNSVKAPKVLNDSHQLWDEACQRLGLNPEPPTRIILNDNHPIEIMKVKL